MRYPTFVFSLCLKISPIPDFTLFFLIPYSLYSLNGKSISDNARFFLVQPGGRSRVQLLWGVVGDIEQLTEALFGVAEEFIHHRNVDEAIVSFRELDGPGVGHEIVRQVILVSLNHGVEGEELCAKLLDTMFSSNTISRFSMVSCSFLCFCNLSSLADS